MVIVWFGVGQLFPGDFGSIISRRWHSYLSAWKGYGFGSRYHSCVL